MDLNAPSSHAMPTAPYSSRPPSPPFIHIPPSSLTPTGVNKNNTPTLMPSYENVDSSQLNSDDLAIITRNATQIATDRATDWNYEQRREAQPLLDFLYLGPTSVVRDHDFLRREGITMLVVVRDVRMAATRQVSVERAAQAVGLALFYADLEGPHRLISDLPNIIRAINDHLIAVYRSQASGKTASGHLVVEQPESARRGKVLVTCETGNERSAAVAAAYIMAVFGQTMVTTLQFVSIQRFCCCFDEDTKRKLLAWEDILRARSQVAAAAAQSLPLPEGPVPRQPTPKRHFDEAMELEGSPDGVTDKMLTDDDDRFVGRHAFVPFVDST